jgi:CRISPR-associated endonuclease/helicase Cas3
VERRLGCSIQEAVRLAIAGHDLGKLDKRWQRWVRIYQAAIGKPVPDERQMIVHTEHDWRNPLHQAALRQADKTCPRPQHAGESAVAATPVLLQLLPDEHVRRAAFGAIVRHHSPSTEGVEPYELTPDAAASWRSALKLASFADADPLLRPKWDKPRKLHDWLPEAENFDQLLLYLLIVRFLRLCDGESQEK